MSCVFISDLHIQEEGDPAHKIYQKFVLHPLTQDADEIFLLGDIFDLCIGDHYGYTKKFEYFFNSIKSFLDSGKKVYFFEGNHDFHVRKVFRKYLKNTQNKENFYYQKNGMIKEINGKRFFICHGYEVDYFNIYFKRWYKIYNSYPFYFLVTYLLPFRLIQYLGNKASKDSKKRGKKTFDYRTMEQKYIEGAKALISEKGLDGVISGHTHIPANKTYDSGEHYLNVGFPVKHKQFLAFENEQYEFLCIE